MNDYEKLDKLSNLIYSEIENETKKGSLTPETVRTIGYAVDILKDITCMKKDETEMSGGYSGHYPQRGYNITPYYSYDDRMMPDMSYAQRRDRMGRYSSDNGYDDGGYSRGNDVEHLKRMMNTARNEQERESLRKLIAQMENN